MAQSRSLRSATPFSHTIPGFYLICVALMNHNDVGEWPVVAK